MKTMTCAESFLRTLKDLGVDYLFTNPGPEAAIFAEVFSRGAADQVPKPMVVPSEALAVSMAHGFYLATGRPQAVLAQFNTGVASSLAHLMGASRMNVPILFISGRPPTPRERAAHWTGDSFEQSNLTREYMRWQGELRHPGMIAEVLTRAWEVMVSAPAGPVMITVTREVLSQAAIGEYQAPTPRPVAPPVVDADRLASIRNALIESARPVVISSRSGLNPRTVSLLEKFAEVYQVGVLCPMAQAVNIRTDHPCFLGFSDERVLREADLVLVLDTDVPWIPEPEGPASSARVIHAGPDPLFRRMPWHGFRSDLNVQTDIEALLAALLAQAPAADSERAPSAWLVANHEALKTARLQAPVAKFNPSAVAEVLSLSLDDSIVLINESSLPSESLMLNHAGGYYRTTSVLGWSVGCALGYRLGRPEALPVAVVGDGAYYLSQPTAALWVGMNRQLPIVTLVLNDAAASASIQKQFMSLSPALSLAAMASAAGANGLTAATRPELKAALDESFAAVRAGRTCLIDARI